MFSKNNFSNEDYRGLLVKNTGLDYDNIKLTGEVAKLKLEIQNLTNNPLEYKIENQEAEIIRLKEQNKKWQDACEKLTLQIKQDEINIDLRYKNMELTEEIKSLNTIIKYKDNMVKELQSLPDVQIMIKNLQTLSVPGMEELAKFANVIKENNLDDLQKNISFLTREIQNINSARSRY